MPVFFVSVIIFVFVIIGCSSNPHKAHKIDTGLDNDSVISGDTRLGVKDGNLIVQKRVKMNEELRSLQNEVYGLEDRVYGHRKYGSHGLYGAVKKCRVEQIAPENGGDGKLKWQEPIDRITDREEKFKIGVDENKKISGVSEEYLKNRIKRFRGYRKTLQKREDEYQSKLDICKAALRAQKYKLEHSTD